MECQFGEVYHLSLIAVSSRNGTEQFSAFISSALEKNLGAIFKSEAIFLNVIMSRNGYLILLFTHFQSWRQSWPLCSWFHIRKKMGNSGSWARCWQRSTVRESAPPQSNVWLRLDLLSASLYPDLCAGCCPWLVWGLILAYLLLCLCHKCKHLFPLFSQGWSFTEKMQKAMCYFSSQHLEMAPTNSSSPNHHRQTH